MQVVVAVARGVSRLPCLSCSSTTAKQIRLRSTDAAVVTMFATVELST